MAKLRFVAGVFLPVRLVWVTAATGPHGSMCVCLYHGGGLSNCRHCGLHKLVFWIGFNLGIPCRFGFVCHRLLSVIWL